MRKFVLPKAVESLMKAGETFQSIFRMLFLDEYVIMPNHVHGVIFISDDDVGFKILNPYQWMDCVKTNTSKLFLNRLVQSFADSKSG